ncbi:MAG: type II toxin-antitoxin system RelE/ParE family toxin [Gammaproteobacteria bacterium]
MIFRVGAERSSRRSVHKVHDCSENREGNNPENSAMKGIQRQEWLLAYRFDDAMPRLTLLMLGPHENFYRDLKR